MAQMTVVCPLCKRENSVGTRFCRHCGRLLVGHDHEVSSTEHAPLYEAFDGVEGEWESSEMADAANARVVIRALPSGSEDAADGGAKRVGEYALEGRTITIGRGQNCDIVLDGDTMTSRRHAILRCEDNRYTVADLGSSNGTFLNDLEIREATPLNHGDRILIGEHELLFLLDQPRPIAAPTPQPEQQITAAHANVATTADDSPEVVPVVSRESSDSANALARPTAAPATAQAGATAKYASVARLSSELAASASRMVAPQQNDVELDAIRVRLVEASEALTRQAAIQAALADRRRAALVEARERIADLIADLRGDEAPNDVVGYAPPPDLATLAGRVAEDPNDLERLRAMASKAGEIAKALRAQGPSEGQWLQERAQTVRTLEDIRYRLQDPS